MDARGWNGEPDARDDAYEHDGHQRATRRLRYRYACEALRLWIAQASNPSEPTWAPYSGEAQANAVWYARHCYREAHALGLLESEPGEGKADGVMANTESAAVAHSPLPWAIGATNLPSAEGEEGACGVEERDGMVVCDVWPSAHRDNDSSRLAHANAEFIVRACNSHDELLAALKALMLAVDDAHFDISKCVDNAAELLAIADARRAAIVAIAKAEGRA